MSKPSCKREIRIQVIALKRISTIESLDNRGTHALKETDEGAFLGTGWRVEQSGALSILQQDPTSLEEVPLYTFAPGRWLEVFEDPIE